MFAEITIQGELLIGGLGLILTIVGYLIGFAKLIARLEMKPDVETVEKMIDKKYASHCPYSERLEIVEKEIMAIAKWKDDRIELLHKVEKEVQQVRINTEMICDSLGVSYKK